jgi:hypothetical protein
MISRWRMTLRSIFILSTHSGYALRVKYGPAKRAGKATPSFCLARDLSARLTAVGATQEQVSLAVRELAVNISHEILLEA